MKRWGLVVLIALSTSLFAGAKESLKEEEMICDLPYEETYSKCQIDEKEKTPALTEKERKLLELDPYKAKGKFLINSANKRELLVWLGRAF